jgi:ATP-dependent Clp protease ATP-binding subunit ClpC
VERAAADDGRLTDGEGWTVDFSNVVLVMTSNLGAGKARRPVGFTATETPADEERMLEAAKRAFLPEFINRIDEIVTFRALTSEQIERIARLIVERVAKRLDAERDVELEVSDELIVRLASDGFDEEYGARPLQRHVRRTLEKELTRAIIDGRVPDSAHVFAGVAGGGGIALVVNEPPQAIAAPRLPVSASSTSRQRRAVMSAYSPTTNHALQATNTNTRTMRNPVDTPSIVDPRHHRRIASNY